jgi:hypothetical protein
MHTILFSEINSREDRKKALPTNSAVLKQQTVAKVATMDQYRFISIERDTTYIDTSLTIKEYSLNYLRKDNFGLFSPMRVKPITRNIV